MSLRITRAYFLSLIVLAGPAVLWTAGCGGGPAQSAEAMTEGTQDVVMIDESGDGQVFDVVAGQRVIVRLPANPSTGYEWLVGSTDKTFGYPTESFIPCQGPVGCGGVYEFVWQTVGPLPMLGAHTVEIGYLKGAESEPEAAFTFTVDIVAATH